MITGECGNMSVTKQMPGADGEGEKRLQKLREEHDKLAREVVGGLLDAGKLPDLVQLAVKPPPLLGGISAANLALIRESRAQAWELDALTAAIGEGERLRGKARELLDLRAKVKVDSLKDAKSLAAIAEEVRKEREEAERMRRERAAASTK
jgi:hypothetical protein